MFHITTGARNQTGEPFMSAWSQETSLKLALAMVKNSTSIIWVVSGAHEHAQLVSKSSDWKYYCYIILSVAVVIIIIAVAIIVHTKTLDL